MSKESIWHDWDPYHQVLKIAFVNKDGVAVFTYRLCPECGVSMELPESAGGRAWTCDLSGAQVKESGEPW